MIFDPLKWFRAETTGTRREPLKKLAAGLVVWLLAGLVVWWNQDTHASVYARLVGTLIGLGLFGGGGVLVLRPLTAWGLFQPWLLRCGTVERLALVTAAVLTLLTIAAHWLSSIVQAWMLAALIGLLVLASAFGWKLPGAKRP